MMYVLVRIKEGEVEAVIGLFPTATAAYEYSNTFAHQRGVDWYAYPLEMRTHD